MKLIPPDVMQQIDQGIVTDILFYKPLSVLHDSIKKDIDVMIDYIEVHRLKKLKECIGQEKPKLDKKV
jgi:hypothetical protein